MKIALCLLTWNEIDGVKHDVPMIDRSKFDQIYCVDGGSSDGTIEYLTSQGIRVIPQSAKGLNRACYDAAEHCECDAVVFFHPKGTIPVSDIYKFRRYFEENYQFVVGSRMMRGGHNEEDAHLIKPRKWFVLMMGFLARLLFKREGNTVWDVLHGFRGMTREEFLRMPRSDGKCTIDMEMVCYSYKAKLRRVEFPTCEMPRIGGETHFKAMRTGWQILKCMFWELSNKSQG